MEDGLPLSQITGYIVYAGITLLTLTLSLTVGRRAFCHTTCWMAPFMTIGRKLGNWLRLPGLRIQRTGRDCSGCRTCEKNCPMGLPVYQMVQENQLENSRCILCGTCVDGCTRKVIAYKFSQPA